MHQTIHKFTRLTQTSSTLLDNIFYKGTFFDSEVITTAWPDRKGKLVKISVIGENKTNIHVILKRIYSKDKMNIFKDEI